MKKLNTYIIEKFKISPTNASLPEEEAIALKKIKYVFFKFFNTWGDRDNLTLYEYSNVKEYGFHLWSIPDTSSKTIYGMIKYFEKIDAVEVDRTSEKDWIKVGKGNIWIKFRFAGTYNRRSLQEIKVSETFYLERPYYIDNH